MIVNASDIGDNAVVLIVTRIGDLAGDAERGVEVTHQIVGSICWGRPRGPKSRYVCSRHPLIFFGILGHSRASRRGNSNTRSSFDNTETRLAGREQHVEGGHWLAEPPQRQLADFFERRRLFDRDRDAPGNEDLSVFGLGTQARGEIAYRADRRITAAVREADLP